MKLRLHRLAVQEIDHEVDYYESRQEGLGAALEDEIDSDFDPISCVIGHPNSVADRVPAQGMMSMRSGEASTTGTRGRFLLGSAREPYDAVEAVSSAHAARPNVTFAVTPSAPSTRSNRSVEMSFVLRVMIAVTRVREVCASAATAAWVSPEAINAALRAIVDAAQLVKPAKAKTRRPTKKNVA